MAHAQLRGDAVASLLQFQAPQPRRKVRRGAAPRDFEKENRMAIRAAVKQRRAAAARASSASASPEPFKMRRFVESASSKVGPMMVGPSRRRTAVPAEKPKPALVPVFVRRAATPRKPAVPRASGSTPSPPREQRDYVRRNALAAIKARPLNMAAARREADAATPPPPDRAGPARSGRRRSSRRHDFGRVPAYLQRRQAEWKSEADEEARLAGEPGCPPGTRRMEGERQAALREALTRSQAELCAELLALPLASDAPKVVRRRAALEARLGEVQEAMGVFDGAAVYEDVVPGAAGRRAAAATAVATGLQL